MPLFALSTLKTMPHYRFATRLALIYLLTAGWATAAEDTAYLGVTNRAAKGGVLAASIQPGSPAEKAGLLKNDLLVAAGGTLLRTSADLTAAVRARRPGEVMELEVLRGEQTLKIKVVLGTAGVAAPTTPGGKAEPVRNDGRVPLLGIAANPDARTFALTEVAPESAAYKAGLRVGDIVRRLNGERLGKVDDLAELLGTKKPGDEVDVEILRNGESITLRVTLGN